MKKWLVVFVCSALLSAYLGKPLRHQMKIVEDLPLPANPEFFKHWGVGLGPPAAMAYWLKLLSIVGGWTVGDGMKESAGRTSLEQIDHFKNPRSRAWLVAYLDGIVKLSPSFPEPYLFAGVMLYWFAEDRVNAIDFLTRGVEAKIDRWEIPYYLGYFHYSNNNFDEAFKYYSIAASFPTAPHVAPLMVSLAASRSGDAETALIMLDALIENLPERMEQFRFLIEFDRDQQAQLVRLIKAAKAYLEETGRPLQNLNELIEASLAAPDDLKPPTGSYQVQEGTVVFVPAGT